MKDQTTDMMKDFADHRDEEINVRLVGSAKSIDFVLTDTVKNTLLDMYDLYVAGGGMRSGNMYQISEFDQVYVEKTENVSLAMLLQLFLTLQLGIYLLISDFTERQPGAPFAKQKACRFCPAGLIKLTSKQTAPRSTTQMQCQMPTKLSCGSFHPAVRAALVLRPAQRRRPAEGRGL